MDKEHKIEVIMTPHRHDNAITPYFWCILEWDSESKSWGNVSCGWAETPDAAWESANLRLASIQVQDCREERSLSETIDRVLKSQEITPTQEFMWSGETPDAREAMNREDSNPSP